MSRLSDANVQLAKEIIGRYPRARSATIPLLHLAQKQNDNFGITLKRPETGLKFMLEKNSNHLVINNT